MLHSPQCHPEMEKQTFSGDASERRSGECASDVALFSEEEPAEHYVTPMARTSTAYVPPQTVEPDKDRFHISLIRHHKSLMKKMDTLHVDFCVATNAYNESQARQAVYEATMLSLQQERLQVQEKVALLANQNSLMEKQISLLETIAQKAIKPTHSTTRDSGESSATTKISFFWLNSKIMY
ncbi:hypothetical protein XENTR_v10024124 [Xenopus tropicalis]|nr:hypothetical protein XENTR_v10024124 [Xenopus tropicalis]